MNHICGYHAKGFTLIEILVTLLIVVIISSTIVVQSVNPDSFRNTQNFADLLSGRIRLAEQKSLSQISIIGLRFGANNYEFYLYDENADKSWVPLQSKAGFWKKFRIPAEIHIELHINQKDDFPFHLHQDAYSPQIVFYPDGNSTVSAIIIHTDRTNRILVLESHADFLALMEESP